MKKMYKIGDNIKIIWMAGEPEYTGRVGTIDHIDDIGQLHGTWGGLAVSPGDDIIELISKMERQYRQLGTYNRMRIITAIEKILVENGCKILRTHFDKPLEIQCYTTFDASKDVMEKVDKLPIINVFGEHLHLNFMHENYYIHFEFDDNPFFPTHYMKIKVDENGNYIGRRLGYTTDDNMKDTLDVTLDYDGIWKVIDDEIIEAMAQDFYDKIKDYIKYGKENEIDSVKRRVKNCYNESYHYETIYDKTKCSIYYNDRTFNHQYIEKED